VILRSHAPDVAIPDVALTGHVLGGAARYGDRVALVDAVTGERIRYDELRAGVHAGARGLNRIGVGVGDVVALVSHNQPRFAVALHAAIAAGATVTPVNPVLTSDEIVKQLTAAHARVLITSEAAAEKAAAAAGEAGIRHVFVLGEHRGLRRFADLRASGGPDADTDAAPPPDIDPRTTVAVLPFSSGTTGLSKGVLLTHRNLVANLQQHAALASVTRDDVLAAVPPFFHIYGFTMILNTGLLAGATVVTIPRFDLQQYLRVVQDHRVTRAYLAPPMVLALANAADVEEYDLSTLRLALCGAAPLDVDVTLRAERRLGCLIRQGYGMTEASPGTHVTPDDEYATTPPGSIGRLLPNTEARLVDPGTGTDVPEGSAGELWVRGPQVMSGYLDGPEATALAITDGWLHTGDLVRVSDDVYWVVDRLKEVIKYKGYQVAPAELEAVLMTHPQVTDAAVIGVPHLQGGEAPRGFVVSQGAIDPDALMAFVAERVAPYKKVRSIEFVDSIPRSATGKILRRQLRRVADAAVEAGPG